MTRLVTDFQHTNYRAFNKGSGLVHNVGRGDTQITDLTKPTFSLRLQEVTRLVTDFQHTKRLASATCRSLGATSLVHLKKKTVYTQVRIDLAFTRYCSLQSFNVGVNHPFFIAPLHMQSLPYCNTIARPLRNIRPPHPTPTPPFMPYTIQYW